MAEDHLRAIWSTFKPLIFIGFSMEVLPSREVLTVPPWGGQFLICSYGCPMCLVQWKWSWGSYLCKVVSYSCWKKRKRKKGGGSLSLCISLLWRIWKIFPEQRGAGTFTLQPLSQERSPHFLYIFGESPPPYGYHTPAQHTKKRPLMEEMRIFNIY